MRQSYDVFFFISSPMKQLARAMSSDVLAKFLQAKADTFNESAIVSRCDIIEHHGEDVSSKLLVAIVALQSCWSMKRGMGEGNRIHGP